MLSFRASGFDDSSAQYPHPRMIINMNFVRQPYLLRALGILFLGLSLLSGLESFGLEPCCAVEPLDDVRGTWTAEIKSPGGKLLFELELKSNAGKLTGTVINGAEKIPIDQLEYRKPVLTIGFPHYDSVIEARYNDKGGLSGTWKKFISPEMTCKMEFSARKGSRKFSTRAVDKITGRYEVKFQSSEDPAVCVLKPGKRGVQGTFLTTTGDYRFLAGDFCPESNELRLSCFDGGHAFLFKANLDDQSLSGDFWSRDSWHEKWTAKKNPQAKLPDGFRQVKWAGVGISELTFPDTQGKQWSLADRGFAARIKIIQVFGSWCPNCHDAAALLNQLQEEYGSKGLRIIGLAFELSDDPDRNRRQIERYAKRTGAKYPILVAGLANKQKASQRANV